MTTMASEQTNPPTAREAEIEALRARVEALEAVCGEAYVFAGAVGAPTRVLDALSAAANGDDIPIASFLPVSADECDRT